VIYANPRFAVPHFSSQNATEALLEEADRMGARRIVYINSTSVYGHALTPADQAVWVDERLAPRARDIYDETKLAAERLVTSAATPSVTLRIARCFPEPPAVLAAHYLHRAVALDDVATAAVRVAEHHAVAGTFNIAGPSVDRVYDSCAATEAFGCSPAHGIHQLLHLR
jgi:nucleoside-diphosphate-sugar epimerase